MTDTPALVTMLREELAALAKERDKWKLKAEQLTGAFTEGAIDGPALRRRAEAAEQALVQLRTAISRIVEGFRDEAMNGVVCSPPEGVIDAATGRMYCKRCKARWQRLRALADHPSELKDLQ